MNLSINNMPPNLTIILFFVFSIFSVCIILRYVFPLSHGLFEAPYCLAYRVSQFGKFAWTKNNQDYNQYHQKMHWLEKTSHFLPPVAVH